MTRLLNYFFRGLLVLAPAGITVYVFWLIISKVDQWLGFGIPGLGIVVTVVLITAFGFLASTVLARQTRQNFSQANYVTRILAPRVVRLGLKVNF